MQTEFVHVGYGGTIAINRVLASASPDSAPIKRMIRQANKEGRIINLTYGRKAKTAIVLDSGHIALAAFQPNVSLRRSNEYRARRGGLLDLTLDGDQQDSSLQHPVGAGPSAGVQQASSLLHPVDAGRFGRRADDYALGKSGRGSRLSAGEEKLNE
jgi:extracellular matrix regulatory protein A